MTTATWPAGLSFIASPDGYTDTGPENAVIRTNTDAGPAKVRRRFSGAPTTISGSTDWLTDAQVEQLVTFFRDTLGDGTLPFTATDPRTGLLTTYRFIGSYAITYVMRDRNRVTMTCERLVVASA